MSWRSGISGEPVKTRRRKKAATLKRRNAPKTARRRSSPAVAQKDMTEARRLEQSLRASEERYALVTEAVAEGIYDWNIELNSLFVSPRLMEIFDFEGPGLSSGDWYGRVHPDDMPSYRTAMRNCFKQRSSKLECQYRIRASDGNYRWVEDRGLPIRNKEGRAIRLVGAISDVSRRHQTEQALRDSEQRYALAMQAINEGVYDWNIETGEIFYSPRVLDSVGLTPEQLGSREDWLQRIHPDDLPAYKQAFAEHLKGTTDRFMCEYRYLHPDGTWHWARQHGLALRDRAGRAYRMAGSTGDVTLEKDLAEQRDVFFQDLNAVLDTIDYGVLFMGPDLRAKIINRAFRQMWGISDEFIRDKRPTMSDLINYNRHNNLYDVPPADFDDYVARRVEAVRRGGTSMSEMRRLDGRVIQYQALALPDGGRMLTYFDITDLKRSEEQARKARDAAETALAENAQLLNELRARTDELSTLLEQQTAMSDVLGAISRSKFELQPLLQSVVDTAARLCRAEQAVIFRLENGIYRFAAGHGVNPAYLEIERQTSITPGPGTVVGRAAMNRQVARIEDAWTDPLYEKKEDARIGGARSMIGVPLMRDGDPIGVIALARNRVEPFADREIDLVATLADQAVIAIENVRLFESVEARTRELAKSLEDLRTAQDRLVQTEKLASLGQLTAGIAHEIKNPLNFVNNFSAVSVELIDELRQALGGAHLDSKLRAEISEIADMLQGNLDKVVQHGKRADAIVKNMLLHSRQGSGEHRSVDINALVEESLNLAYHGARAEKQGFEITLERSFDPAAGEVDVFPQEITRALLNLISNGFYAATKRQVESNGGDFEPTLTAATENLGDSVEIRIRDNGIGIPSEVKEKLFNPFFTTKPAGEGTGLGLSICHDIIVKQHGGSIEVDTKPGNFTEFRIVLPRAGASVI